MNLNKNSLILNVTKGKANASFQAKNTENLIFLMLFVVKIREISNKKLI